MANQRYTGSASLAATGGEKGVVNIGATEYTVGTNSTVIVVGTDRTDSFSSVEYDLGSTPISGKRVTLGIDVDANGGTVTNVAATTTFTFDGASKTDNSSIVLIDGHGTSKTYVGRTRLFSTATVTITDFTELNSTDKVNLIATDGTNYDFVNGDQSSVAGTWESTTSNNATATNLMNVINTSSGPAGTRFTATVDEATVTITQATIGSDGNTTVTLTDTGTAGMTKTNFTGGQNIRSDEFTLVDSATTTGDNFIALVNGSNGHNGTITAANSSGAITLTQVVKSIKGNTLITSDTNFDAACTGDVPDAAFTGGADLNFYAEFSPTGNANEWTVFDAYGGTGALVYTHNRFNPTGIEIANDLTLTNGSFGIYSLDLTSINTPFIRLGINSQGRTLPADLGFTFNISYPVDYDKGIDKETWSEKGERN